MAEEGEELYRLLDACYHGNRHSQDRLYRMYYGYAMGICLRYAHSREEAVEILNDGFVKVFTRLERYTQGLSFKGWLRKVMIHTAIDYFRRHKKHYQQVDISYARHLEADATILDRLSAQEILQAVQQLPASYRIVFNLFVVEGYTHHEIARHLDISVGTSKSNLAVARTKLQKVLAGRSNNKLKKNKDGRSPV